MTAAEDAGFELKVAVDGPLFMVEPTGAYPASDLDAGVRVNLSQVTILLSQLPVLLNSSLSTL